MKILYIYGLFLLLGTQCFSQIPKDKQYHIGAGIVLSTWGTFAANSYELKPEECFVYGLTTSFFAGIGKELVDDITHNGEIKDLGATMLGGLMGSTISYAGLKIFKKHKIYISNINKTLTVGFKVSI